MISVLVVAGSAVIRAGLEALVSSSPQHLSLAGRARALAELSEPLGELQADVTLMEAYLRGEELTAAISGLPPVVLLTDEAGLPPLRAGARAVLPAGATAGEIVAAIQAVHEGLLVLHPEALEQQQPSAASSVTAREVDVLRMMAAGLANKEIAHRLGISEHTVKFHVASLFGKLNASSRTEAVTVGVRQGLIFL